MKHRVPKPISRLIDDQELEAERHGEQRCIPLGRLFSEVSVALLEPLEKLA